MSGAPTAATVKRLFALSGNKCAFPKCNQPLVHHDKVTGRICHIKAANANGPRFDQAQTIEERHGFSNLLLLCPIHHDVIDADAEAYTVKRLWAMKSAHERASQSVPDLADDLAHQFVTNLSDVSVTGGSVIITNNQSGGIAAHTVNISAPLARRITAHQRQLLLASLQGHLTGEVEIDIPIAAGPDAMTFADDFASVLSTAGWRVQGPTFSTWAPITPGLELIQRNRGLAIPLMQVLSSAFDAAQISYTPLFDSSQSLAGNSLRIIIGPPLIA